MANDIADKLAEARKLIERGWCQGHFKQDGCYCAWGALLETRGDDADEYIATKRLLAEAIGFEARRYGLPWWNDAPERTQAEVIEAFRKAEELARAA